MSCNFKFELSQDFVGLQASFDWGDRKMGRDGKVCVCVCWGGGGRERVIERDLILSCLVEGVEKQRNETLICLV